MRLLMMLIISVAIICSIAFFTLAHQAQKLPSQRGINLAGVKILNSETSPDPELEKVILKNLPGYSETEQDEAFLIRYYYNRVDLNGDEKPEVLVYLSGAYTCGTGGCTMQVYESAKEGYRLISEIALVNNPIIVSNQKTAGWSDLIVYVAGGGIRGHYAVLRFNGRKYPTNASAGRALRPKTKVTGQALIADEISPNSGIKLRPAKAQ